MFTSTWGNQLQEKVSLENVDAGMDIIEDMIKEVAKGS